VKASAPILSSVVAVPAAAQALRPALVRSWVSVYADLFKARLTLLVLLTAWLGFYAGVRGAMDYLLMLHALLGTALMAAGASALNQWWERDLDGRMQRTQDRPLPSGRLRPRTVFWIGVACSASGLAYLAWAVNPLTAVLGLASLLIYLLVYTPLKRRTWLNTIVGAVPGALPPLMGWTAARGELGREGWALFTIQALWQMPHFMAIAWIYREEYAKAGFQMLPVLDPEGRRTARHALGFTLALLAASALPFLWSMTGPVYAGVALLLGLTFVWHALQFSRHLTLARARQLFYVSILYLPLLLAALALDKWRF